MTSIDLRTHYLGLTLNSPIIVGACPMTLQCEQVRQFAISGAGAVVLPSLFEEQVVAAFARRGDRLDPIEEATALGDEDTLNDDYNGGLDNYIWTVRQLKNTVGIPVIASLNGTTTGHWLDIGRELQDAGADALEITAECWELRPEQTADETERQMLNMISELKTRVTIPIAVKISPFHSNLQNLCWQLYRHGAAGVVCFGSEPVWNVAIDQVTNSLHWPLTSPSSIHQTIAGCIRAANNAPPISLAACGGVSTTEDVIRCMLAGANGVMMTSEIYRNGPDAIAHVVEGLTSFINRNTFGSLEELAAGRPKPELGRSSWLHSATWSDRDYQMVR
ncbi:MAG: dihydroorotate dehydrogenase [Aureliella sp.]